MANRGEVMNGNVIPIPIRIGDVNVLVAAVRPDGWEQTSALDHARERVIDGFAKAEDAMVEIASRMASTINRMAERSVAPERLDLEFGLTFTLEGNVIVGSASGEASLKVTVSYDTRRGDGLAPR
jgi:hypothetical protein